MLANPICDILFGHGALAQLGERHTGSVEVVGSSPIGSIDILITIKNSHFVRGNLLIDK